MLIKRCLNDAAKIDELSKFLATSPEINKLNRQKCDEASTLANAFSDIEGSFVNFLNELLPKLTEQTISEAEIKDCLLEIGEEFRHILYHINDLKFYKYLHK